MAVPMASNEAVPNSVVSLDVVEFTGVSPLGGCGWDSWIPSPGWPGRKTTRCYNLGLWWDSWFSSPGWPGRNHAMSQCKVVSCGGIPGFRHQDGPVETTLC